MKMTHPQLVATLVKPGDKILSELTPGDAWLIAHTVRLLVLSGKLMDVVKKRVIYRKDLDEPSMIEGLGCIAHAIRQIENDVSNHHHIVVAPEIEITGEQMHLLHMAIGIAGEGCEILEAIESHVINGLQLDRENIVEELGDHEFYNEGLRQPLSISREKTLDGNIAKLQVRYDKLVYSDEAAIERADKRPAEEPAATTLFTFADENETHQGEQYVEEYEQEGYSNKP